MPLTDDGPHLMPCMEVWGGNRAVDCGVVMSGLDAWLYAQPFAGDAGGGDVHYVSSCATGRVTRMLVADVSGHGADVAETGEALRQIMRRYVNHIDQTRFVVALNHEFRRLADVGRFATSVVATFFAPTSTLTLCNAGHPPPLVYSARRRDWAYAGPDGGMDDLSNIPLGILEDTRYDQFAVRLKLGDLVLLYTDSVVEARDPRGRELGAAGLLELVRSLDASAPDRLVAALLERLRERTGGDLPDDDLTLLLFRPNGLAPRVPLRRRVMAPVRVVAGVLGALAGRRPAPWPEASLENLGGAFVDAFNHRARR